MNQMMVLNQIDEVWGRGYMSEKRVQKTMAKDRYLVNDGYCTNGFWLFPEAYEPIYFKGLTRTPSEYKLKETFDKCVYSEKEEMYIDRVDFLTSGLGVILKGENFESIVNPVYLSLLKHLNHRFDGIRLWQKEVNSPILVDSDRNESMLVIMPIRGGR